MKYAGLLVMPAGFFLSIAAIVLFPHPHRGRRLCSAAWPSKRLVSGSPFAATCSPREKAAHDSCCSRHD